MLKCQHSDVCGACSLWDISYGEELALKQKTLSDFLKEQAIPKCKIEILSSKYGSGYTKLRDRADLQWRSQVGWGFYEKPSAKGAKEIQEIKECVLFTPELQKLYDWFSQLALPVPVASARLRVRPNGQWGVWLDMANLHVKDLLKEQNYLRNLKSRAFVEIGQRRKKLLEVIDSQFKLGEPEFLPWFQTYSVDSKPMPLSCSVGSFTQVGFALNEILVNAVLKNLGQDKTDYVMELGAGIGNFTLPVLSAGIEVLAIENDKIAVEALTLNLKNNFLDGSPKINLHQLDFNQISTEFIETHLKKSARTSLLVDPPRSGLGKFLTYDFWNQSPFANIVYVSCSLASWAKDVKVLFTYGYKLKNITLVDQFPRTNHMEIVSLFERVG